MTLVDALQEIEDAHSKGLLTDSEASSQKTAILERHSSNAPSPLWYSWPRRHGCCSPNRRTRIVHWWIAIWAVLAVAVAAFLVHALRADVWISCSSEDTALINVTHPRFCDPEYDPYDYDEDDCEDHSKYFCGNERFEFDFKTVKYSSKFVTTEISWIDLIGKGPEEAFVESLGNFTGNSSIFSETDHGLKVLKAIAHIYQAVALIGIVLVIFVIRRTFYQQPRVEKSRRWVRMSAVYAVLLGLGIATLAVGAHLAMLRTDDHHNSHHHHGHRHREWHATQWAHHYPSSYGCEATPHVPVAALLAGAIHVAFAVLVVAVMRSCCLRCRDYNLDEAQAAWQAHGSLPMSSLTYSTNHASPSVKQVSPAGGTPPPYLFVNADDEKMLLSATSLA